jgi:hypothetical protein
VALPADFNTTRVYGKYVKLDGSVAEGTVTFTPKPTVQMRSASTATAILPATFVATLDEEGFFEIDLPATDDPDIVSLEWEYVVRQEIGGWVRVLTLPVPVGADIDLTTK